MEKNKNIPDHVVIIPDGNRRWAKENKVASIKGHEKGEEQLEKIIQKARDLGIHTVTVWGFSTDNWKRSKIEIEYLMRLFETHIENQGKKAIENQVKFVHLGRKDRLPKTLVKKITEIEEKTKDFTKYCFNLALDYGGHDEITRAVQKVIKQAKQGLINAENMFDEIGTYQGKCPIFKFSEFLDTSTQKYPYVDLIIRTSGENRTSGILPWQTAYAEHCYVEKCLPDFTEQDFEEAILKYSKRERTMGGNTKQ